MKKIPTNPFRTMTRKMLQRRADKGLPLTIPFLRTVWEPLVGEDLADRTLPIKLQDGVLILAVPSLTWIHELSRNERELRRTLNQTLPTPLTEIQFVKSRKPFSIPQRHAPKTAPRLGQLSHEESDMLSEVEDEDIRNALTRIRRLHLGKKNDA